MPMLTLCVMTATGSPGIRRGRMKFNKKAKTKVIKNQPNFLRKYCRYPFNGTPPCAYNRHQINKGQSLRCTDMRLPPDLLDKTINKQPCPSSWNMAVFNELLLTD